MDPRTAGTQPEKRRKRRSRKTRPPVPRVEPAPQGADTETPLGFLESAGPVVNALGEEADAGPRDADAMEAAGCGAPPPEAPR